MPGGLRKEVRKEGRRGPWPTLGREERREAASSGTRAQRPPDLLLVFQHPGTFKGGFFWLVSLKFFQLDVGFDKLGKKILLPVTSELVEP